MKTRTFAEVRIDRLKQNLSSINKKAQSTYQDFRGSVAMVKANGYGHGILQVSKALSSQKKLHGFGVATLQEALDLRHSGIKNPIWIFSETTMSSNEYFSACNRYGFSPVLHNIEDLVQALNPKWSFEFHLKWNTGLNRLGFDVNSLNQVREKLLKSKILQKNRSYGFCTHFAMSENSTSSFTQNQVGLFKRILSQLPISNSTHIHCANTDAVINESGLQLGKFCNIIRPGIGIYGYSSSKVNALKLKPCLIWKAQILKIRNLTRGDCVGYGATFKAKSVNIFEGILGIGYGDGFHRKLSNKKIIIEHSESNQKLITQILGRVSMDLTAIDLKNTDLKTKNWVTILGGTTEQGLVLAQAVDSIIYEVLTSISERVPRVYK